MVRFMGSKNPRSQWESSSATSSISPKFEIEDSIQDQHAPLNKRHKATNDILNEPSPLGLSLRKSPSLLDLIQMTLCQENSVNANTANDNLNSKANKNGRASVEKLKASNFPATHLKIGSWEYKSKYEGDLVAKCYFAKQKLVWEVLEGELKSKIEIQWSDISQLKANCPDDGPSTLTLMVARQPLFFRETNPQPRKHTLWQSTTDFTGGQASIHRRHVLQCEQGLLIKHYEKLVQCNDRLKFLSQQPEIMVDSPHFDPRSAAIENPHNLKDCDLHQGNGSAVSCFQNMGSPHSSLSPSFTTEHSDPSAITLDSVPCEAPSSSSEAMYNSEADSKGSRNWDQIKLPGLRPSMSMSDFLGHIEHHISKEMASGDPSFSAERLEYQQMMDGITQHLLNDNQVTTDSDEKSLMSRVNSLRCLLQMDPPAVPNSHDNTGFIEGPNDAKVNIDIKATEENSRDVYGGNPAPGMSRKDSFGDLLLSLPRIASLPKFLFDISED
ncbi:hypothetical protein MtrunA17_Chr4g0073561 [Medicago truncatula]|uniref:TRF2/HOY1 PH-like domain-containing protein n=1 Tax=Medicago truncatula TaxID=3880 RepID=G7JFH8_MEDTR|nr:uncharacterized protein LOC11418676 [Medicago truncatula]AES92461.1 hypothetical protein MTR_4g130310 [Medicago truncatula]AFK36705.1 unknown [Medicago truncatula]RHN64851.1 hypothetical protein MtrunA17_Chr4g0073561 [Medicago truncatula]